MDNYKINGVYDAQDLQKRVTEQCNQMDPIVRALFTICEIDDKTIVSAEIPGVDIFLRPVFYKGVGRIKGSFIRVGEKDELMNEYEVYSYEAFRKRIRDDLRIVENSRLTFIDEKRMEDYLNAIKRERKNLSDHVTNEEILELMGVTQNDIPRLAGIMTFSRYPQAYFPQLCITAIALTGTKIGEIGDDEARFIDNKRITGAIPDMLDDAVSFVLRNSRTKTIIKEDGKRIDKNEYPIRAIREAILNALVHRDYSIYTENTPVRIEMYRDHMEITNSGGLYGRNELTKENPIIRNIYLINILEFLSIVRNKNQGISIIRDEFAKANFPEPIFSTAHGEFKVIMKNGFFVDDTSIEDALIEFCSTPRSRKEIIDFANKSKNYVMSQIVTPLIKEGKLKLTLPNKPKSPYQRSIRA